MKAFFSVPVPVVAYVNPSCATRLLYYALVELVCLAPLFDEADEPVHL